jgi:AcrR family transcriptional regulator
MIRSQRRSPDGASGDTRRQLLDATVRLIESDGPAAATSRSITAAAGANLAAITYYYGSKDALIAEALVDTGRRLLRPVIAALGETASPIEQMVHASRLLTEVLGANTGPLRGYVQALAAAIHDPAVRDALATLHREIAELLAEQIRAHQESNAVPGWVDPTAMAATIVSLVDGVAVTTAAELTETEPSAIAGQFATLLARAARP